MKAKKRAIRDKYSLPIPVFLVILGLGTAVVVAFIESPPHQVTYVAVLAVLILAVGVDVWLRARNLTETGELLTVPLALAQDQQIFDVYRSMSHSVRDISSKFDPIFHELAVQRLQHINAELGEIARGQIIFTGTETWRMAYDQLLRSRGLHLYRSVAYLKTPAYWQDEPGRQSMETNFARCAEGSLTIQRIAIIPDSFWPSSERLPAEPILTWVDKQRQQGIAIRLARLSSLSDEPELVADIGIYGNRAVGRQEIDEAGRTVRFILSFDFSEVLDAEKLWERMSVYATPLETLVR